MWLLDHAPTGVCLPGEVVGHPLCPYSPSLPGGGHVRPVRHGGGGPHRCGGRGDRDPGPETPRAPAATCTSGCRPLVEPVGRTAGASSPLSPTWTRGARASETTRPRRSPAWPAR